MLAGFMHFMRARGQEMRHVHAAACDAPLMHSLDLKSELHEQPGGKTLSMYSMT